MLAWIYGEEEHVFVASQIRLPFDEFKPFGRRSVNLFRQLSQPLHLFKLRSR
jgi:hypothetical protein